MREREWTGDNLAFEPESPFVEVEVADAGELADAEIDEVRSPEQETLEAIAPRELTLPVTEFLALWDGAAQLNERLRRMAVGLLDQQKAPRPSNGQRFEALSLTAPLLEGELFEREDPQKIIDRLLANGTSENEITNAVFWELRPTLRNKSLRQGTSEAREWLAIRDQRVRPGAKQLLGSHIVHPVLLAAFFSQYENDSRVPKKATEQFLTRAPLLSMGRSLRDRVIWEWQSGSPPLTAERLYQMAYELSGHPGSAMLLCHNVTKAFARGGVAINWDRDPKVPEKYSDGRKTWTPKVIHRAGKLVRKHSDKYNRELPVIYWLLFADSDFGTDDWGDWYHYFVAATFTAFDATGDLSPDPDPLTGIPEFEDRDRDPSTLVNQAYELVLRDRLIGLMREMVNPDLVGASGYRGWLFANAVSFLEGAHYGETQTDVDRESRIHRRGALAGLQAAGATSGKHWMWHVPAANSVSKEELTRGFPMRNKTMDSLDASGRWVRRRSMK